MIDIIMKQSVAPEHKYGKNIVSSELFFFFFFLPNYFHDRFFISVKYCWLLSLYLFFLENRSWHLIHLKSFLRYRFEPLHHKNLLLDLFAHRISRSACAVTQSDHNLHWCILDARVQSIFMRTIKTDETAQMCRLNWVFIGLLCQTVPFLLFGLILQEIFRS